MWLWKNNGQNYVPRSLLLLSLIGALMLMSIKQEIEFIEMLFWLHLDFFNPAFHFVSKAPFCNWWERFIVAVAWFASPGSSDLKFAWEMWCVSVMGWAMMAMSGIGYFWLMEYQFFTNVLIFSNGGFQCVTQLCVSYTWACPEPPLEIKHPFLGVST